MYQLLQQCLSLNPESFVPILMWASFTACLSLFLDRCFQEGMIFEKWLEFWAGWWMIKNGKQKLYYDAHTYSDEEMKAKEGFTVREFLFENVEWFWFKPLGYCVICSNVWASIVFIPFTGLNIMSVLFYIVLSNFIVRITYELLH